jgi:hypothetical protein
VKLPSLLVLLVSLSVGCKGDAPRTNVAASSSTITVLAGWESTSIRRDSSVVTSNPASPAEDSPYAFALAANILPDEKAALQVRLAASDETDVSNYQASGWWLGPDMDGPNAKPPHYSADFVRFTSGVLLLKLDTTLVRNRTEPPFDTKVADSIAVRGLGRAERFATDCRFGAHPVDERLTGVVPDSVPDRWMKARLAWLFDTVSARIRRVRPDSISCMLSANPD